MTTLLRHLLAQRLLSTFTKAFFLHRCAAAVLELAVAR